MSWDEGVILFHCIDVFVPDVFVPDVFAPDVFAPDVFAPVSAPRPGPYPNQEGPNREGIG